MMKLLVLMFDVDRRRIRREEIQVNGKKEREREVRDFLWSLKLGKVFSCKRRRLSYRS